MKKGFVALLDVLGFSEIVSRGDNLQSYLDCLQNAFDKTAFDEIDYVVFSDSIVLTTREDSEDSFNAIIRACSRAFGLLLENEFPIRGAIAHGPFLRSPSPGGVFVAGKSIIDAYRFEQAQDWVGIMLAPSVIRRIPDLANRVPAVEQQSLGTAEQQEKINGYLPLIAFLQPYRQIPFHASQLFESNTFDGFALVPTTGDASWLVLVESLRKCLRALEWLKSLAPEPAAQAKYQRSHQWLYGLMNSYNNIKTWEQRLQQERQSFLYP